MSLLDVLLLRPETGMRPGVTPGVGPGWGRAVCATKSAAGNEMLARNTFLLEL